MVCAEIAKELASNTARYLVNARIAAPFGSDVLVCGSSLCSLSVLGVSVVNKFAGIDHHRDTEDTMVAQRNPNKTRLSFLHVRMPGHVYFVFGSSEDT
jgi:hypothetical protein